MYIDVEINTLEDAYINIAKEEHKLLMRAKGIDNASEERKLSTSLNRKKENEA